MKFEIRKEDIEISYRNRRDIKEGCTQNQDDHQTETVKSFDSKEEALNDLKGRKTEITELSGGAGKYYLVTEYFVEEIEVDEDGEETEDLGTWGYSKMAITLVEQPSYEEIGTYESFADAEDAFNTFDGEAYLSF